MGIESINKMTEGLAPVDRSDVKDEKFKMPKAPGDKYIKSGLNLLFRRTPLGMTITGAKLASPYIDDAIKFFGQKFKKDPTSILKKDIDDLAETMGTKNLSNPFQRIEDKKKLAKAIFGDASKYKEIGDRTAVPIKTINIPGNQFKADVQKLINEDKNPLNYFQTFRKILTERTEGSKSNQFNFRSNKGKGLFKKYKGLLNKEQREYMEKASKVEKKILSPSDKKFSQAQRDKLRSELHIPSSKDIDKVSPVIKDAIQKELIKGQVESLHPAMITHRGAVSGIGDDVVTLSNYATKGRKESAYGISTNLRNKLQIQFEKYIPTVTAEKNKLISQFKKNEITKDDFLKGLAKLNDDLNLAKADMEKLGLMSKLFNPRTKRIEYFGKPYNNTLDLIKDIRNEYNLFSKVGKKYGTLGGTEKIPGLKAEKMRHGGIVGINQLVRPL
tara:strand:- start:414 stop:1742 length:1329 start_codon:yes stop_codon:yes gene_type:complete